MKKKENIKDVRNPGLYVGKEHAGYKITKIIDLTEIDAVYYELTHLRTAARHIHISRDDNENAFAIGFKTAPSDNTGVAHILEHTVLCGSEKYPVRDPFFSMIKRSLNTFMNAFTASDWTMYPYATQNEKDYYNLMSVYLDAVFFPRLDPLSFKQEGYRVEPEIDPGSGAAEKARLVFKGVVYNEMKGAMSSPDQIMIRSILNALYPDTTYGFNSGGDPAEIPNLTYEDLVKFHKRHYHPGNAYFFTYGNFPLEKHLEFIEQNYLSRFSEILPGTDVATQKRWDVPRRAKYYYPIEPGKPRAKKSQVCLAWLVADIRQPFEILTLSVLENVLLANPGSPLRMALMESGIGSTLSDGTGYDAENKDTLFSCGLKDVDESDADAVEELILETLKKLCETGIERRLVDSALHQIEFARKEVTNTPYPYGLKLLLRFFGDWIHGGEPSLALKFDSLISRFLSKLDEGLLENTIKKYFLENRHRVRITLAPDPELDRKQREMENKKLEKIKAGLSPSDYKRMIQDAETLARLQEEEEDVSCLPTLELTDITPDIKIIEPSGIMDEPAVETYEQPTSGIFYFTGACGISGVSDDLLPMLPFFCHAMTRTGTKSCDYVELARRIDEHTGGIGFAVSAGNRFSEPIGGCLPMLTFSGKCLSRKIDDMFALFEMLLTESSFTDLDRIKTILLEVKTQMESAVIANGHRLALSLAARNFSTTSALNELWHGVHQLRALKDWCKDLTDRKLEEISGQLLKIASAVFNQKNIRCAIIGEARDIQRAKQSLPGLFNRLPLSDKYGFQPPEIDLKNTLPKEGWATSTAVSFVGRAVKSVSLEHPDAPALAVSAKIAKSLYLHREIREKGGAYGGFSTYQPEDGLFFFASYRDPHILSTLSAFDGAARFLASGGFSDTDIKEAILQVCADIDHPDPPSTAATKAFYRRLAGLDDDLRKRFKNSLLGIRKQDIISVAKKYLVENRGGEAVISSRDRLDNANQTLEGEKLVIYDL